jgi:selenocysteine lyase/cysteine desulfurase
MKRCGADWAMHAALAPGDLDSTPSRWRSAFDLPAESLYLDTAAHAPMLRAVRDAGVAALAQGNRPWLPDAQAWDERVDRARAAAAHWFDGDADGVAFVPSAAYGLSTAARNLPLATGDAVLVLDGQFPSNLLPWQQRAAETCARIVVTRRKPGQDWTAAVLETLAHVDVRIVALPQVHWHDGAQLDIDAIAERTQARGTALVLDLSQSLGAVPTDVARWKPEFVVSVGYKWLLGPFGLALLWAAPRWREHGSAIEQHWAARDDDVWRLDPQTSPGFGRGARRFDAGGVLDPLRLSMFEAAQGQLHHWGPRVRSQLRARMDALDDALRDAGLASWNTADHAPHFTGLRPPPPDFAKVVDALRGAGITCTARHGVVRIAPHLHVSPQEITRAVRVMAAAVG